MLAMVGHPIRMPGADRLRNLAVRAKPGGVGSPFTWRHLRPGRFRPAGRAGEGTPRIWSVVARLILRLAIAAASLAWAGFVFTHTVGDPDRGERIAEAVLADDAARAQVVGPITAAVMRSTGLPSDESPFVAAQVEAILRQPDGASAFVDAFAGGWARTLGNNDRRGSQVDIAPFLADIAAARPGLDLTEVPTAAVVPATVPIPRADLPWFGDLRRAIEATILPLAVLAAVGMATAFAIGDRRWVLRRVGIWAAVAGAGWLVAPLVAVWAARQWATGADEVVRVAVEEAVSGLRPAAIALLTLGIAAVAGSVAWGADTQHNVEALAPAPGRDRRRPVAAWEPNPAVPSASLGEPRRVAIDRAAARPSTAGTIAPTVTMASQVVDGMPTNPRSDNPDDADEIWTFYTRTEE